jgi:hypothetical protein
MKDLPREISVGEVTMFKMPIGLFEKALPDELSWEERLTAVDQAGYDFVEISIDESNERLSQLDCFKGLCRLKRLFRRWCKQAFGAQRIPARIPLLLPLLKNL